MTGRRAYIQRVTNRKPRRVQVAQCAERVNVYGCVQVCCRRCQTKGRHLVGIVGICLADDRGVAADAADIYHVTLGQCLACLRLEQNRSAQVSDKLNSFDVSRAVNVTSERSARQGQEPCHRTAKRHSNVCGPRRCKCQAINRAGCCDRCDRTAAATARSVQYTGRNGQVGAYRQQVYGACAVIPVQDAVGIGVGEPCNLIKPVTVRLYVYADVYTQIAPCHLSV